MKRPRSTTQRVLITAIVLGVLGLLGMSAALAQPQPQQTFFGYSRLYLPALFNAPPPTPVPTPQPVPQPKIVVWLDIPAKVRINDRMSIIVNIENQGRSDFNGRTEVIIPYEGRKFYAADSSFDRRQGDWVRRNDFPTDLTIEFGELRAGEHRRGVVYYDFRANGANAQIGDNLRVRARFNNGVPDCGSEVCPTNQRYVEVTDQFTTGGIGALPPGSSQTQKLGDIRYGDLRRWVPEGFKPGEQVTTWLNVAGGGTRPLTLQQRADSAGKVYFNIDVINLRNGFYSIIAHGQDTRIEIVGEFQVVNSPLVSSLSNRPILLNLPSPSAPSPAQMLQAELAAQPAQTSGTTTLFGVAAAAGTNGATRLQGVQVNVVDSEGTVFGAAATDIFGGYIITGLPTGTYSVTFDPHFSFDEDASRYQPLSKPNIAIPASGTLQVDAELAPGSSVSGTVTTGANPVEGVSVILLDGDAVVEATTTTISGTYRLNGVPSGTYRLRFDPATAVTAAYRSYAAQEIATVAVSAPNVLSGQNATLSAATDRAIVSGRVTADGTNTALNEVFVVFEREVATDTYAYSGLVLTDADGNYTATLAPGTYRIAFTAGYSPDPTSATYQDEYYNNAAAAGTATPVDLVAGATFSANAALAPGGTISGVIAASGSDDLIVDAVVFARTSGGLVAAVALSDDSGTYRLTGLADGDYQIEVLPYLSDVAATRNYAGEVRNTSVSVSGAGTVAGINFSLEQGGAISGTVGGNSGGLAGVLVLAFDTNDTAGDTSDDSLAGLALSADSGAYTLPGLPTGSYAVAFITELTGSPDVAAYFDQLYNGKNTIETADPVAVTAGETTADIDVTLTLGGQIRGTVTAAGEGVTLSGVLVEVFAAGDPNTLVAFAVTDETGSYATTALTPGQDYIVRFDPAFIVDQRYAAEYYDNAADAGSAQAVTVANTTPVTGINVVLEPLNP